MRDEVAQALEAAAAGDRPLLASATPVLVACSGGADSTALAVALVEQRAGAGGPVVLGHVDHGLRPGSAAEATQVEALAARLGVPFRLACLGGPGLRDELARSGLEAAARRHRYQALVRLAREAGCSAVATGHTRRDQAETVLLRMARGAGPAALAGVRRERLFDGVALVRPLLDVTRAATEQLCAARGLLPVDDPHNGDPQRARTRVREAFGQLAALLNPSLEEALARLAAAAAEEEEWLGQLTAEALRGVRLPQPAERPGLSRHRPVPLLRDGLAALARPLLRRVLLQAARDAGASPERVHLDQLCLLLQRDAGALDLPGGRAALRRGQLSFWPARRPAPASPVAVPGPGRYTWGELQLDVQSGAGGADGGFVQVDQSRAPFPWTLRGAAPGDRFRQLGGHRKKVAELWIDAGVPREERPGLPVLTDCRGEPIFVGALRPGEASRAPLLEPVGLRFSGAGQASEV